MAVASHVLDRIRVPGPGSEQRFGLELPEETLVCPNEPTVLDQMARDKHSDNKILRRSSLRLSRQRQGRSWGTAQRTDSTA